MNDYLPFAEWILEVAEEKIIEYRLLKKKFESHEEFIIFTIIWMRVYKNLFNSLKKQKSDIAIDKYIKDFYNNQKNKYLGMTINAITRESEIPRSTVKRIVEKLISKNLVSRNVNRLIIPKKEVRDYMKNYRQYIFQSQKKLYNIFNKLELNKIYDKKI